MHQKTNHRLSCCASIVLALAACANQQPEGPVIEPMRAQVIECRDLVYSNGANPGADQPAHVRAGSAVSWLGDRLAVVQDDARIIALVDSAGPRVDALLLPAGEDGVRVYDEGLGNKALKLDLEAVFTSNGTLYAFGSGSSPKRESVVIVGPDDADPTDWSIHIIKAHSLYAALRADTFFSGSELNIEGAAIFGETVRFFQRGNGAPSGGLQPVNATCDISVDAILRYLEDPSGLDPPAITNVRQYDLGQLSGVRLTFSDATVLGDGFIFLASAENSPDALRDGPVTGVVFGLLPAEPHDPSPRWAQLVMENGEAFTGKAEGICLDPTNPGRAFIVTDRDDPTIPAEMCTVVLTGLTEQLL